MNIEGISSLSEPPDFFKREWQVLRNKLKVLANHNLARPEDQLLEKSVLLQISLDQSEQKLIAYGLSREAVIQFDNILGYIEDVLLPCFLCIYHRFKFYESIKDPTQSCETYAQQLDRQAQVCEFGQDKDRLLKKQIGKYITDPALQHSLLETTANNLESILRVCQNQDRLNRTQTSDKNEENISNNKLAASELDTVTEPGQSHTSDREEARSTRDVRKKSLKVNTVRDVHVTFPQKLKQPHTGHSALEKKVTPWKNPLLKKPEGANNVTERPKRKISVPLRLKSDSEAMKILKFTERCSVDLTSRKKSDKKRKEENGTAGKLFTDLKGTEMATSAEVNIRSGVELKDRNKIDISLICSEVSTLTEEHVKSYDLPSQSMRRKDSTKEEKPQSEGRKLQHNAGTAKLGLKSSKFHCMKCSLQFKNSVSLSKHLSVHKDGKKYTCKICNEKFKVLKHLMTHKKIHGNSQSFLCDLCGKSFEQLVSLKYHLRVHVDGKTYKCDQAFTWKAARRHQLRLHTGQAPHLCDHRQTDTTENPDSCDQCGYCPSTAVAVSSHKHSHAGENGHQCEHCNKTFQRVEKLGAHRKMHLREAKPKNIVCEVCGKRFECPSNLKLHSRKHTGEKPYKCQLCSATFGWLAALKRHERTHSKERPFSCDICHRSFADKPYLSRHKLSHTGERPFECDVCSRTFVVSYDLRQHMKIHSSDKKFVCEVCGMSFVRKCYLYKHKRIHFGVKTHQCKVCSKKFFEPNRLRDHMKRHEKQKLKPPPGSKHHLCSSCGKGFAKKAYLIKHIMTHTGNKPYGCDICGAKFVDSFKLKRHKNIHTRPAKSETEAKKSEPAAMGQFGIQILTEAAEQVKQEQTGGVIGIKEGNSNTQVEFESAVSHLVIQQVEDVSLSVQELHILSADPQGQDNAQLQEGQQIIITHPQLGDNSNNNINNDNNVSVGDQPCEVIIFEVWSPSQS